MASADFRLVVDADTTSAKRELDAIRESAEKTRKAREEATGEGRPSGDPGKPSDGPGARRADDEFGRRAGDVAGKAIGKAVAGFLAHEAVGAVMQSMRTVGGDNTSVDRAESALAGAAKYGTMGAMLGGPAGAVIGAALGAGAGLWQQRNKERQDREAAALATRQADYRRTVTGGIGMSDAAFRAELSMEGNYKRRIDMMGERARNLQSGPGEWSVANLQKTLAGLTPGTARYDAVAQNIETQKERIAQLQQQMFAEALPWKPRGVDAGEVTDAFAKRGIEIGAQADVGGLNDKVIDELRAIRQEIHAASVRGADTLYTPGAQLRDIGATYGD